MNNKKQNNKQLKLNNFCKEFDIPESTAKQFIHSKGFPAYKICGRWYVDIDEYYKWRRKEHLISYKYA